MGRRKWLSGLLSPGAIFGVSFLWGVTRAIDGGAVCLLAKPFDGITLISQLEAALETHGRAMKRRDPYSPGQPTWLRLSPAEQAVVQLRPLPAHVN
jgi:FixJ family two-component response regulator